MLKFAKIVDHSLWPEYREGDFVLIAKIPLGFRSIREGDVVVFKHPLYGLMIKKVRQVGPENQIYVTGTHEKSVDSRQFGAVSQDWIMGKVVWHIGRPTR